MSPEECIRALDRALEAAGEDVILRRVVDAVNYDVTVRVREDTQTPIGNVVGAKEGAIRLIMSPTPMRNAGWPNQPIETTRPYDPDPAVPQKYDIIIRQGRSHTVLDTPKTFVVQNQIVRIELLAAVG